MAGSTKPPIEPFGRSPVSSNRSRDEGAPASERTDVWVFFDENSLYVTARAFDSAPPSEWVANEMRHDVGQLRQNDSFSFLLDTFHDQRNGVAFLVTPIGGYSDFAITNEGNVNTRLEYRLGHADRPVRGRLDRRNRDPIQVAPVSTRRDASVGHSAAPHRSSPERSGLPDGATHLRGPRKQRDRRTLARV